MRLFHKLTAVLLALCLTVAVLPPACFATGGRTHTLPDQGDLQALINSDEVSNGDTIVLLGTGFVGTNENNKTDAFWLISKKVTIQGGIVVFRAYGAALNADVTFRNTQIAVTAPTRNAIFANGHELTLDGVTLASTSSDPLNLFCGSVINSYNEADFPNLVPGTRGVVNISGNTRLSKDQYTLGNIYAGNFCAGDVGSTIPPNTFAGEAVINIEGTSKDSWALGDVYACGAQQWRVPVDTGAGRTQPPQPAPDSCTVSGTVSVNGSVKNVYGAGANDVRVICASSGGRSEVNLQDISSLEVGASGHVYMEPTCTFKNIDSEISVPSGTKLDITQLEPNVTIGQFNGGGSLAR